MTLAGQRGCVQLGPQAFADAVNGADAAVSLVHRWYMAGPAAFLGAWLAPAWLSN